MWCAGSFLFRCFVGRKRLIAGAGVRTSVAGRVWGIFLV